MVCVRESVDLPCGVGDVQFEPPGLWYMEAVGEGDGKAARMSDIEPDFEGLPDFSRISLSLAFNISSMPIRLAVLPRSRLVANLVARRMSSGRLVVLPRTGLSFALLLRLSGGGLLRPFSFLSEGSGEAVPLVEIAPPFSRWPRMAD